MASHSIMTSILLRSPSPSPSPASTPLPALQTDLSSSSSSSSSSASGSCLDLHHSSAPPTRRIRFAPLPDPRRDILFEPHEQTSDDPYFEPKPTTVQALPAPNDPSDGFVTLSPSLSPDSTLSSAHSTPTIRVSAQASSNSQKSNMKLLRPFSFLRTSRSSSPSHSSPSQSPSLSVSRDLVRSSTSLPNSPSLHSAKLPRFTTEDILTLGTKSFFRARTGSVSSTRSPRPSSPPPKSTDVSRFLHRSASTSSAPGTTAKRDIEEGPSQPQQPAVATASSAQKKRRASSSVLTPGAGGGRHACSVKLPTNNLPVRPSTAPSSPIATPKKHVKMLNGRVYGAKRYAAQTLANPFANVRNEPEFVEWGYGGMGSVHASAGIANEMWKGVQRSERGGALLAGSSFGSTSESNLTRGTAVTGSTSGSRARATSPTARRKMTVNVPECSMGNVGAGGADEDDGSGMGWVKRRRAEREAKARLEQEAKELKEKPQEGRRSGDSMEASIIASTASTTTSLTACTSTASSELTTPATSPLVSRSPSLVDLNLTSPPAESRDLRAAPGTVTGKQSQQPDTPPHQASASKDGHEHHVLTAVRLSPNVSNKHGRLATHGRTPSLSRTLLQIRDDTENGSSEQIVPLSPVDTEETTVSANSIGEEPNKGSDEGEEEDVDDNDEEDEGSQDIRRKTALGAGVEKISRHVDAEAR